MGNRSIRDEMQHVTGHAPPRPPGVRPSSAKHARAPRPGQSQNSPLAQQEASILKAMGSKPPAALQQRPAPLANPAAPPVPAAQPPAALSPPGPPRVP